VLLQAGFSIAKVLIPKFVPFYADPYLAAVDTWLHGGTDPWEAAYAVAGGLPVATAVTFFYFLVWSGVAVMFPMIVALTDPDRDRVRRYGILFFAVWLVVGLLLATAFASVGPIYYDAIYGGDHFAGLRAAMLAHGLQDSSLGVTQTFLLDAYKSGNFAFGAGISAFPSVHVAMATLVFFYMLERLPWAAPLAAFFLLIVVWLSVLTGYHYAVDGYAAALIVGLMCAASRVSARQRRQNGVPAANADAGLPQPAMMN
jgi:membrane-associated phospholipid phosphatase